MVLGALLICSKCGSDCEFVGEWPTAEQISSHREDYRCDCGGDFELDDTDEANRLAAYCTSAVSFAAWGG